MAKQVQVRYEHNTGSMECRDLTVGRVYNAELPEFGEVDKDGVEVMNNDELWIIEDDVGDGVVTRLSYGFVLVEGAEVEQDDPLPPAPESVRYNEGAGGFPFEVKSLRANAYHPNRIRLGVLCGDLAITHKYVVIDPNTALQLAHDLNRMANEIKRKGKQNG